MPPLKRFMDGLPWRWWGSMSRRSVRSPTPAPTILRALLREGRWEGVVHRRGLTETNVVAAVRQIVRRDTTGGLLDIVEFGRNAGSLSQAAYLRMDAELQSSLAASWELDTSPARPLLDAIAEHRRSGFTVDFDQHPDWVDKMLTATRILAVNDRAVRIFGAHAGYEQMIGQPVGAFWPAESRSVLAALLESVASDRTRLETRKMVLSGSLRDPVIKAWHSAEPKPPDTVFVTINGVTNDERTSWELQASEARYRQLIQYLPTALWQVDSRRAGEAFDQLKANGVRDIAASSRAQSGPCRTRQGRRSRHRRQSWTLSRCSAPVTLPISSSRFGTFLPPLPDLPNGSWSRISKAAGI